MSKEIQQWEYEYVDMFVGFSNLKANLDLMGSQGWELVCVTKIFLLQTFIFKRPKNNP